MIANHRSMLRLFAGTVQKRDEILADTHVSDATKGRSKRGGSKPFSFVSAPFFEDPALAIKTSGVAVLEPSINAHFPEIELRDLSFTVKVCEAFTPRLFSFWIAGQLG